ncbi:MAG: flagellar hook-associated protein FlgK [Gammaproteobacteria bacterium]|nr:flagellar hook-associated protein FlgK [Gammaproteobacteria bacterium]MBU1415437.1 flagellar hook-associated protein FlgK [Gammaproteobacteria bacterium]
MSTLSIGISGLNAASIGLATTSHNIANSSTPGYNRQVIVNGTNFSVLSGSGYIGQGAHVETVKRIYSEFLSEQVMSAQTSAAEMDSYLQQISQIDNILADASIGLSSAMSGFFDGVQAVAADPSSIPARQSMLSTAQTLISRFQLLDQRMAEIREGVNSQITSEVSVISSYSSQIAQLNERILFAQAGSQTQQPNDLLDQRDQLIAELNEHVRVSTLTQSDGTVNLFFGNGQPLVVGTDAYSLGTAAAADDPERTVVVVNTPGGTAIQVQESQIAGGTLGGLISFRSESLDAAQNALGRVAIGLTQTFNNQHQLGQDLTGALGGDFFSVDDPTSYASSLNTGSGVLAATFSSTAAANLTTSDYQLSFAGGVYTLKRLSDNQTWTGASAAAVATAADQGFDLTLTGTPLDGDSFKIEPTRSGAGTIAVVVNDTRNIAAAAPMRTAAALANTGTGSIGAGSVNSPAPPDANLQQTVTITFTDATHFNVVGTGTGNPTGVAYTAGASISYNGWTTEISGAPRAGDVFTISVNTNGVSDNRNAVALAALQTADTMIGGTASHLEAYAQLVSEVGNKTREVKTIGASQTALAESAIASQQALSGVNLDEEAANLMRYQQAYQASAKVIEIASKVFDSILALG